MVQDKPKITQKNINNLKILQHQNKEPGADKVSQPIIIRITLAWVEGRGSSLYHNAGASANHRQPDVITNPEGVLVTSKRDTPDVSGNIKEMSFDNFLQMPYHKLVQ